MASWNMPAVQALVLSPAGTDARRWFKGCQLPAHPQLLRRLLNPASAEGPVPLNHSERVAHRQLEHSRQKYELTSVLMGPVLGPDELPQGGVPAWLQGAAQIDAGVRNAAAANLAAYAASHVGSTTTDWPLRRHLPGEVAHYFGPIYVVTTSSGAHAPSTYGRLVCFMQEHTEGPRGGTLRPVLYYAEVSETHAPYTQALRYLELRWYGYKNSVADMPDLLKSE